MELKMRCNKMLVFKRKSDDSTFQISVDAFTQTQEAFSKHNTKMNDFLQTETSPLSADELHSLFHCTLKEHFEKSMENERKYLASQQCSKTHMLMPNRSFYVSFKHVRETVQSALKVNASCMLGLVSISLFERVLFNLEHLLPVIWCGVEPLVGCASICVCISVSRLRRPTAQQAKLAFLQNCLQSLKQEQDIMRLFDRGKWNNESCANLVRRLSRVCCENRVDDDSNSSSSDTSPSHSSSEMEIEEEQCKKRLKTYTFHIGFMHTRLKNLMKEWGKTCVEIDVEKFHVQEPKMQPIMNGQRTNDYYSSVPKIDEMFAECVRIDTEGTKQSKALHAIQTYMDGMNLRFKKLSTEMISDPVFREALASYLPGQGSSSSARIQEKV